MIDYITTHLKSISSYVAVLLTVLGTLLASGTLGEGTAYHIIGYVISILTVLGFKALPQTPAVQPTIPAQT